MWLSHSATWLTAMNTLTYLETGCRSESWKLQDNEGLERVNAGVLLQQLPPHLRRLISSRLPILSFDVSTLHQSIPQLCQGYTGGSLLSVSYCRLLRSRQFLPRVGPQIGLHSSAHARSEPALQEVRAKVKSETEGLHRMSGRARPSTPARFRMTSKSADGSRSAS